MRVIGLAFLALALCVSAGCSTGTLFLKLSYAPSGDAATNASRAAACRIHIATIVDDRPDARSHSIGHRGDGAVFAEHIPEWVAQGLDSLVGHGFAHPARFAAAPGTAAAADPEVIAGVSIRRVYVHSVAIDLEAVIVLEAQFTRRDGSVWHRSYRGHAQKLNWASAGGEYEGVLNRALEDVIHQISRDLRAACGAPARSTALLEESGQELWRRRGSGAIARSRARRAGHGTVSSNATA